jgi:stage II sporulation protein D
VVTALALLFAAGAAHALPAPPRRALAQPQVRVLLGVHARAVIQGYDLRVGGALVPGTSVFNVRCGPEPSGAAYVEYGAGRRAIGRLDIFASTGFVSLNDRTYRNRLTVIAQGGPACAVVNTLDLEKYVAGVIAREMAPGWPLEALKAQAVASRSYALFQIQANRAREYDLENGTQDQVYEGAAAESARTTLAAQSTRGEALVYGDAALKAYFHANCGGITEVPELVWGGEAHAFRPVVCPYHTRARDRASWSALITRTQLESVLISANTFRNALGNTRVKSTAFHIHRDPAGYRLEGEGNGHGVGLCQVGARAMAERGRRYRQILEFYYPLAKIQPL